MTSYVLNTEIDETVRMTEPVEEPSSLSTEDQVITLFSEMRAPLMRYLIWLNLTSDQAEDIIQETFLRLFQHLSRADFSRRNLRGWVWRVSHNLGLNLRLAANNKENGRELALHEVSDWLADPGPDPEQTLQEHQKRKSLERGMQLLAERDKQCFRLRAQGMGYRQIATALGMGRSTVADTIERVTTTLRNSYSPARLAIRDN